MRIWMSCWKTMYLFAIVPYKRSFISTARSAKVSHAGDIAERMPYHCFGWMGLATEKPRISKLSWWLEICESFQNNSPFSGSCMSSYIHYFPGPTQCRSFGHGAMFLLSSKSWTCSHMISAFCVSNVAIFCWKKYKWYVDVSKNRGTPKPSILIGFSIINHPFWGFSPYFWKHPCDKT